MNCKDKALRLRLYFLTAIQKTTIIQCSRKKPTPKHKFVFLIISFVFRKLRSDGDKEEKSERGR